MARYYSEEKQGYAWRPDQAGTEAAYMPREVAEVSEQGVAFMEAPASWNTRYISKAGFECQLTLRHADPTALLKLANEIMGKMAEAGVVPVVGNGYARKAASPSDGAAAVPAPAAANGNGSAHGPEWCAVHQAEMKLHTRNGQSWYSHKMPDGTWCRGTA